MWPPGGHCAQPGAPSSPSQASVFTVLCPHFCRRCGRCQELWQIRQRVEKILEPTGGLRQCPSPFCTPFPGATAPVSWPCCSPRSPRNATLIPQNPKVSILHSWVLSPVLPKCCPHISLPPSLLDTSLLPRLHPPVPQLHTPPRQKEVGSHIVPTPTPQSSHPATALLAWQVHQPTHPSRQRSLATVYCAGREMKPQASQSRNSVPSRRHSVRQGVREHGQSLTQATRRKGRG